MRRQHSGRTGPRVPSSSGDASRAGHRRKLLDILKSPEPDKLVDPNRVTAFEPETISGFDLSDAHLGGRLIFWVLARATSLGRAKHTLALLLAGAWTLAGDATLNP